MRTPDEVRRALVRRWLDRAAEDLGAAERLLSGGAAFPAAAGFHAQQAAEKYLKAFLTRRQVEFPKTHDLAALLDLVARVAPALAGSLPAITALTPYGVESRYPGDFPVPTAAEARQAVTLAEQVRVNILAALQEPE